MSWTKRQFITTAFEEIGYADYVFDLQPEQLEKALWRLDSMMASWNAQGIRIGYPLPSTPEDSSLTTETSVPDSANMAIYMNLALVLAPTVGKMVSPETKAGAKTAYDILAQRAAAPVEMQFPGTLPSGAGNKPWRNTQDPFLNNPTDPIDAGSDSAIDFY